MLDFQIPRITSESVEQNRGTFTIEPLDRGFGYTFGNSLRRVLLSSLSGAAVTRGFDSKFRLETVGLNLSGVSTLRQKTTFDAASWVDFITDETPDGATVLHKFDYSFKPGAPFVQAVSISRGATADASTPMPTRRADPTA